MLSTRSYSAALKSHQRQLLDCSNPFSPNLLSGVEIPPTAVAGLFKCFLPKNYPAALKSHQRQLVDCSNAFYPKLLSGVEIPPTAVAGLFKSFLPESTQRR